MHKKVRLTRSLPLLSEFRELNVNHIYGLTSICNSMSPQMFSFQEASCEI